ncbi:hypothetical protein KM043_009619 [Ampulex compressa]|nr:hypothetical protein KM043_009619 [Ampulex compressa]
MTEYVKYVGLKRTEARLGPMRREPPIVGADKNVAGQRGAVALRGLEGATPNKAIRIAFRAVSAGPWRASALAKLDHQGSGCNRRYPTLSTHANRLADEPSRLR